MGYSCTRDAADMLGNVSEFFKTDGNRNILTIRGSKYFFERGKEQADGHYSDKTPAPAGVFYWGRPAFSVNDRALRCTA